ncbi:hypothetical protein GCM10023196_066730 [Actinoallomurus vinaceus]|uniref:Uncharacterized protein n=1 Tax=Actinoallomurus vinaceus TaxID=1080074 RepID=A0ABP8UJF7_9ACTN
MPETLTFANLLDDAAIFSLEHQLHLGDVLGEHSWHADLQAHLFEFTGSRPLTCTGLHLLGSAAPGPRSWLWGWANPSGFPEPVTALSATLRDFGQQHGIAELASAEVPFDALPGSPTEPAQAVGILTDAAKAVSANWTSYNGPVGGGTRAAFLIEHPDFQLPPPEPARVMHVIQQALSGLWITDHRRALHAYAVRRRLGAAFSPDGTKLTITGPGLEAVIDFDQYGRVANINASLSAPGA